VILGALVLVFASAGVAQDTTTVDIYRFILGVDVPEPSAFVILGVAPTHVLRGSAPKPIAASVLDAAVAGDQVTPGVAVEIAPYFLLGGGMRTLGRLRAMSLRGRLTRVLTKTVLSLGAVRDAPPGDPGSPLVALALRSTFHDPHDPALNSRLPEELVAVSAARDEEAGNLGVDLRPIYARARRAMRARAGDPQISGGWGVALRARGGALASDSLVNPRHTVWLSAQLSTGRRLDVLSTIQIRNAFRGDARTWLGLGLERKTVAVDYRAELSYETRRRDWHPGVAVDARVAAGLGVTASLTTTSAPRQLALRTLLYWFYASDR
jgi:hypothetical protein